MANNHRILIEISEEAFFDRLDKYYRDKYYTIDSAPERGAPAQSWLSHAEASAYLKVPEKTLYQLSHKKIIKYHKSGRKNVYRQQDLDNYLLSNEAGTTVITSSNFSSHIKSKKNEQKKVQKA